MESLFKLFSHPELPMPDAGSSSTVMPHLTNGIIKDPFTFDYKIHEDCPTSTGIDDNKRKTVDRFWRDIYLKSFMETISHVQDWFTKISYKNKLKFTMKVIGLMVDTRKLFDLAYFIGPPKKDSVYAHTQFTRSPSDVAATDHNRALEDNTYDSQSSHYCDWFQSLNPREQFDVVVGLIHLGGSALEENIYGQVAKILEEKDRDVIRKRVLQYLATKRDTDAKVIASKVARHKQKLHRAVKKKTEATIPITGGDADNITLLQRKIAEYDNALKSMESIIQRNTDSKPRKLKKDRSKSKSKSASPGIDNKKLFKMNASLDRVQMLPLWDNRKIISMLSNEQPLDTTKVNKYWKEMVERTKKELKVRKKIDKFLGKVSIDAKPPGGHKDDHKMRKATKKTQRSVETKHRPKEDDIVPEDYHGHLDPHTVFTADPQKLKPFSNPPENYVICNQYVDDRAMDAHKRWAAFSKNMDVEFCNVVFGVPCNIKLEDAHTSRISCVCFHPNDVSLVFTGGHDGHVKLHDVWKKSVKMVYAGHKGIVSDVVANCRYVASCGMDNTVRVFNISDGRCMLCLADGEFKSPCVLLMTNCAYPLLYVANIHGEVVMYSVRESGSPQKIGKSLTAHHGEVTSLNHYPCVLLTTGVDGFARMWATNLEEPLWILSLRHPARVNSAAMSYGKVVSAGEDGKIRIWDVMSGNCEKTISITPNGRPILSLRCIQCPNSVKLVLNTEENIRVVEFLLKKPAEKNIGRRGSKMKAVGDFKKKTSPVRHILSAYDRRMMKSQMRQAVLPSIRPSQSLPSPQILQVKQKIHLLEGHG